MFPREGLREGFLWVSEEFLKNLIPENTLPTTSEGNPSRTKKKGTAYLYTGHLLPLRNCIY
jgi:hypothetical protein